jgi:hypothetical protein
MRQQRNRAAFGTRALWVAAAVLAATNLGILVALSYQEKPDRTTRAHQEMDSGASELRKSMLRDQAVRMARDLAAMRRNVEPQTATATRTVDEASPAKQPANADLAELQESLQQEHERASKLEQDLAAARRDVEAQTALAAKAGEEASQLKKTADGSADLRKSLQLERERASKLEQDLATARRDVETRTALASKEAAQLKQVVEKGSAEQRQSLQQEHDKAEALAQELSMARAQIYAYDAQARQASDQAAELKQATERGTADLQKSLEQERDRASKLEQDLAIARRDVETQTALAAKAGGGSDLQKSMQEEHARADRLERDLAAARREVETKTALATKASAEAARVKQAADSSVGDLQKSLQQEHARAGQLERDLAAARRDVETRTELVFKASAVAAQAKRAAEGAGDLQKSLQQERDRADQLEQDLAAARHDVETMSVLVIKVSAAAARAKQAAQSSAGASLQQEHDRADQLEQDLAAARRDAETKTALAAKASDEAAQVKQAAERSVGELQNSLRQERDQRERLERNLASADHAKDAPVPPEAVKVGHTTQAKPRDTVAKPND